MMREPRARLVSHWLYWRSNSDEALAPWGEWGEWVKSARQDFATFLSDPRAFCQTDNVAARLLLQPHQLIENGKLIAEAAFAELEHALKTALDRIDFVGFTEDPILQLKLGHFIGQPIDYQRENVTTIRDVDADIDVVKQVNSVDPTVIGRMTYLDKFVWSHALERSGFTGSVDAFADQCFRRSIEGYSAPGPRADANGTCS